MRLMPKIIHAAFAVVILAIGPLTANGAPGDLFASINGAPANGAGSIYKYTPDGVQSTVASGLSRPRGLAFDSVGNLFVATNSCHGPIMCDAAILKIRPDGTQNEFGFIRAFFAEGVVIDRSDNVFVIVQSNSGGALPLSKIYKFTPDGLRIPFAILPSPPLFRGFHSQGWDLAFDSMGNLFASDSLAQTIYKFGPDGTRSTFVGPEAFTDLAGGPVGLAFDHFGNLFVSIPFSDNIILTFTPSAVKSTVATGLDGPMGLVFDSAGNLFVAEIPLFATGDILKFTPDGMRTVFASGIGDPQGRGGPEFLAIQP